MTNNAATVETPQAGPGRAGRTGGNRAALQRLVTFGLLVLLCIVFSVLTPAFRDPYNLTNVLRQSAVTVVSACAATLILISGGLDISIGGVLALSGVVAAHFAANGVPLWLAMLIGVGSGLAIGLINGLLVVGLRITPIIVTLGTMNVARGLAFLISGGSSVVSGLPESFPNLGREYVGPIPIPVIVMALVFAVFYVLLHRTLLGKYTYAIGGNDVAARLSGVNVRKVRFTLYALGGLTAGLSGILMASRLASGQPNIGVGFEFDVIVAVILGGTSLSGGEGTMWGTLIGALIVGVMANGLNLLGVHTFYQYILQGVVLVLAVLLDMILKGQIHWRDLRR